MERTISDAHAVPAHAEPGPRSVFEALRRLAARAMRGAAHRASLRALARLEPHHLADIGITRADVRRELREAGLLR